MDACPDFFNRGGWPPQSALTLNPIEGFETTYSSGADVDRYLGVTNSCVAWI